MKKYFIVLVFFLSGCTTYNLTYQLTKPESSQELKFRDSIIDITFNISPKSVNFDIINISKEDIKVLWDDTFIKIDSLTKRIFHNGVKYSDRNDQQLPSIISSNDTLSESMTPSENVKSKFIKKRKWIVYDLFPYEPLDSRSEIENKLSQYKGKSFDVLLTLEKNNQKLNYRFEFIITDFYKRT